MIGYVHSKFRFGSLGRSRLTPPLAPLLGLIAVLTVFPISWMVVSSLMTNFELLPGILFPLPMFLILFCLQRQMVSRLTAGAVE